MAQLSFDASTVKPNEGALDPIPEGWYVAQITESEMKPVKDAQNKAFLALTYTVLEGEYTGRKVRDRLNLVNDSQEAVEIAYGTLSAICHSVNVLQINDTAQLHGIPMRIRVSINPGNEKYKPSNNVDEYKSMHDQVGNATATQATPMQTAPAAPQQPWQQPAIQTQAPPQTPPPQQPAAPQTPPANPAQPWQQPAPPANPAVQAPAGQPPAPTATPPWQQPQQ